MSPRISFIVPVRNDATRLQVCLRSIQQNRRRHDDLEIIVVDNGSTDNSGEVAERLGARVLTIDRGRVSELRNLAARRATGAVLAFVDADNEISPGWMEAALGVLQMEGVAIAGALYRAPVDGTWVQRAYGLMRGRTREREDVSWLGSGNLAVLKTAFESVGGFDTSLEACEDVDLCARMRARGFRVVGDPRIDSVHHGDPKTLRDVFVSELWRGRDNLRVSFRRPLAWAAVPSAIIPIADLALAATAAAATVAWLGGWAGGPWLAGGAVSIFALGALIKIVRAAASEPARRASLLQGFVVACVYDLARAIALVTRAPHRNTPSRTATAAS